MKKQLNTIHYLLKAVYYIMCNFTNAYKYWKKTTGLMALSR